MRWLLFAGALSVSVVAALVELSLAAAPEPKPAVPKADPLAEPKAEPKADPTTEPKLEPKVDPKLEPKADPKAEPVPMDPMPSDPKSEEPRDIRDALGVGGPARGLRPVEVPKLPEMTLRGYIRRPGQEPAALLEIVSLKRTFVVRKGSEIPILVTGRPAPLRRDFRSDPTLAPVAATKAAAALLPTDSREQSQVILKVLEVTTEGVKIEAGTLAQTLIVR